MNKADRLRSPQTLRAYKCLVAVVVAAMLAAVAGLAASAPAAAQPEMVTFSGTVNAQGGISSSDLVVTVTARCSDVCGTTNPVVPDYGSERARPASPVAFLGETEVNGLGNWSITVPASEEGPPLLVVWDRSAILAAVTLNNDTHQALPSSWMSAQDIDAELVVGGRVSGRITDPIRDAPHPGDYALVLIDQPDIHYALRVDPLTGDFTSPALAPGEYRFAHGNHLEDHLANNDAARAIISAGRTTDVGKLRIQLPGTIAGTVTDSAGRPLAGVSVTGQITSQSLNALSLDNPFGDNAHTSFQTITDDDGTYSAQNLLPSYGWQIEAEVPLPQGFTDIAASDGTSHSHSCAIRTDNTIACWGSNRYGQTDAPVGRYTAVTVGWYHSCAIRSDNAIVCWGRNNRRQSDDPTGRYATVASGGSHSCAIRTNQTITCWGDRRFGQADAPAGQYVAVAAGDYHSCAIRTDQTIVCWGGNTSGQADPPGGQYTDIAAGYSHSCAIRTNNRIVCWGDNEHGQSNAPTGQYTDIAAGGLDACAIRTDQTIACWGWSDYGRTGALDGHFFGIAAGSNHACAIRTDYDITCWGDNEHGQSNSPTPSLASVPISREAISAEEIGVRARGTTTCDWGWPTAESDPVYICGVVQEGSRVTFSGTVAATGGRPTDEVIVTVNALCRDWCYPEDDGSDSSLGPSSDQVLTAETQVDSSGNWSVTVMEVQPQRVLSVELTAWDTNRELASHTFDSGDYSSLGSWRSLSGIHFDLELGGRVTGRFSDQSGEALRLGNISAVPLFGEDPREIMLEVNPRTGIFTSPLLAPGEYTIAHGDHGARFVGNNDAARFEITAGRTVDVGVLQVQQSGQLTGTITDKDGRPLSDVAVYGEITSNPSQFSGNFELNGSIRFRVTTDDDGTFTAQNLYPSDNWRARFDIPVPQDITSMAIGGSHSCAIRADQTIACWGNNSAGQTDAPDGQYSIIAAGSRHTCALGAFQTIACWGDNRYGQTNAHLGQYIAMAPGTHHTCAIRTDQTITCWGRNNYGQTDAPDGQFTVIATGTHHSCAITTNQAITCWGRNNYGQTDAPRGRYTALAPGSRHTCVIRSNSTIGCWGDNTYNQTDSPSGRFTTIATSGQNSCAIGTDQAVSCWGRNNYGQIDTPRGRYTTIAVGGLHSCALGTNQAITCWGYNFSGQTDAPDGQFTAVAVGTYHTCAIGTDQTVSCWGANSDDRANSSLAIYSTFSEEGIAVPSGGTVVCTADWNATVEITCSESTGESDADKSAAARCFATHQFGAQPVDVAKTTDGQTVLAQVRWGYHDAIGCYLTLDEAAVEALQAAPAPSRFPAGDPNAAQRCFANHKFGAQPVDVAKTADHSAVLAQVRWGYHDAIGCFLRLDEASTNTLRAAHG